MLKSMISLDKMCQCVCLGMISLGRNGRKKERVVAAISRAP